jgi:hypothetical protein
VVKSHYEGGNLAIMPPSHKLVGNDNLQKSEFLHHALYLMSLCNHTFPIYHLVVVVLLNDVQLGL